MRIALTAGSSRAFHVIALAHALSASGHDVCLLAEVNAMTATRLRTLRRQYGTRALLAKASARFGATRRLTDRILEVEPLLELLDEFHVKDRSVKAAAKTLGARYVRCADLNNDTSISAIEATESDVIIYGGGGILRRRLISAPRLGVLNAHSGPIPEIRGMNAAEWSLFYGFRPTVTIHWIDEGIDTGASLKTFEIPIDGCRGITELRGRAAVAGVVGLIETIQCLESGPLTPLRREGGGLQYFVMHPNLVAILEGWLLAGRSPGAPRLHPQNMATALPDVTFDAPRE